MRKSPIIDLDYDKNTNEIILNIDINKNKMDLYSNRENTSINNIFDKDILEILQKDHLKDFSFKTNIKNDNIQLTDIEDDILTFDDTGDIINIDLSKDEDCIDILCEYDDIIYYDSPKDSNLVNIDFKDLVAKSIENIEIKKEDLDKDDNNDILTILKENK